MNSSFYNGVAGMKAHQIGIDIIADNIANVNTPGFRATTAEFSTIYSEIAADNFLDPVSNDRGVGSVLSGSALNFNRGALIDSPNKYDLAIEGDGFFGLQDENGDRFYTRAGNFNRDAKGFLVDENGAFVLGTDAGNIQNGAIKSNPNMTIKVVDVKDQKPIHIPETLTINAEPTKNVHLIGPLDPTIKKELSPITHKMEEIRNKDVYQTEIYDSKGNTNLLAITFQKQIPQKSIGSIWDAKAVIKDSNGNIVSTKEGQIQFNENGALISNTLTSIDNNGTNITLNFGTPYSPNIKNSGYDGLIALANASEKDIKKNGNKAGVLLDYNIDAKGNILASFDNGKTIPIAKIVSFHFDNNQGLEKIGGTRFKESANSGKAKVYTSSDGTYADIASILNHKVEMSNVSITTALTELIVMQKAFDANSKSITTSDQLIQNAINMKR